MNSSASKERVHIIYVIMPFTKTPQRKERDLTDFFNVTLKGFIEGKNGFIYQYLVKRSDNTLDINEQIMRDIYEADIVICDLSGIDPNPNVMYELGVRFSVSNRPVILIREENVKNRSIFDIAGLHTFSYSALRYSELQKYIVEKISRFERNEEEYRSPVIKALKHEPSVLLEIERKRVNYLLQCLEGQSSGLIRAIGGAVFSFLKECGVACNAEKADDLFKFMNSNIKDLKERDWSRFSFHPSTPPAITAFLTSLPLSDMIDSSVERRVNTFMNEYYAFFLSSGWMWEKSTCDVVMTFMHETFRLTKIAEVCNVLVQRADIPSEEQSRLETGVCKLIEDSYFYKNGIVKG